MRGSKDSNGSPSGCLMEKMGAEAILTCPPPSQPPPTLPYLLVVFQMGSFKCIVSPNYHRSAWKHCAAGEAVNIYEDHLTWELSRKFAMHLLLVHHRVHGNTHTHSRGVTGVVNPHLILTFFCEICRDSERSILDISSLITHKHTRVDLKRHVFNCILWRK